MITSRNDATPEALAAELERLPSVMDLSHLDEALYFPKFFQIETTRLCNARCVFCAIDQWDKSTPFMADELFDKIAKELLQYRDWVKFLDLQRAGEPLLDKKIYERIKFLKDGGMKHVVLTTNAAALNKKNATRLLESGLDELMLSIDSVDKQKYEATRVGLRFEETINNIIGFFELRNAIAPNCHIRVRGVTFQDPDTPEDLEEMEKWEAFWTALRKPRDRIYLKRAHNWGNQKIIEGHTPEYAQAYHPCIIPWSTMHITAMGKVALCPQDYDATADLGDINVNTIAEVWRGEKMAAVRRLHATGERNQIALCQGCRVFDQEFSLEGGLSKGEAEGAPSGDATLVVRKARALV